MLGSTADSLYWTFRYIERAENIICLVETGFQLHLISPQNITEWNSILKTTANEVFLKKRNITNFKIINLLLKGKKNPDSLLSLIFKARSNARRSRVSFTKDVWEAINSCWIFVNNFLEKKITEKNLDFFLKNIKMQLSLIFGYMHRSMLKNEILNFCMLGTFIERFDNTIRILNTKHYRNNENSETNNNEIQLEILLRSISSFRSFMWKNQNVLDETTISNFLIFDKSMPRSLLFCIDNIFSNLKNLVPKSSKSMKEVAIIRKFILYSKNCKEIYTHENLVKLIDMNINLGKTIEDEFNFQ